jgi:plastocyanin
VAVAAAAALAVLCAPAPGAGAETTITVEPSPGEESFAPRDVTTSLSDARFRWVWGSGGIGSIDRHDVLQTAELFSSGPPRRSGEFALSASAGRFPYICTIHPGMRASLAVQPEAADGYPRPFRVFWGSHETQTGTHFDVRYKVERVGSLARRGKAKRSTWRVWRVDARRFSGVFGRRGKPVRVRGDRAYRFQARSKAGERRRSGWSPPLTVGPGAP